MRSTGLRSIPIAVVVAAIALLATAGSAAAATIPIQGGEVDWGIKASFRGYVTNPRAAAGKIELSGGAVEAVDGTYRFPVQVGTYDLAGHATTVQAKGAVRFTGHFDADEVPVLDLTIADPRVVLEGETGTVFADVRSKSRATGVMEDLPGVEFATLDTSGVVPSFAGDAVSLAGIAAELTAAGAAAFGSYSAGEALDPVGVVAAFEPTSPPIDEGGKEDEGEKKDDDPKPESSSNIPAPVAPPEPTLPLPTLKKAAGGATMVGGGGAAKVATVSCPTAQACTLKAPRKVRFKAGGKQWSAKVIAPHWILPGKSGKVTVKVPRAALGHLAGGKAKISLNLVLGVGTQSEAHVVKATLKARGH